MPVARPLPQTPQAAEYVALATVKQFARPLTPVDVASDCANVVADANAGPVRALAPRKVYAGVVKEIIADTSWAKHAVVRKVPAHQTPSAVPAGRPREDAVGNNLADALAKEAGKMHGQPSPAMVAG